MSEDNEMMFETQISARFFYKRPPTPEEQKNIDALNAHAEEITERLQPAFQQLVIEMLDIKREHLTPPPEEKTDA